MKYEAMRPRPVGAELRNSPTFEGPPKLIAKEVFNKYCLFVFEFLEDFLVVWSRKASI